MSAGGPCHPGPCCSSGRPVGGGFGSSYLQGDDQLRSVDNLPDCFRKLFPSFRFFNPVQSECFGVAFESNQNMVVAAPTGSGKTVVMELAILRLLRNNIARNGTYTHQRGKLKVVYIAPTRSLVQEKVRDWQARYKPTLGLSVEEMSGDVDTQISEHINNADIICATPEKFDSVTRKHKDYGGMRFFGDIALVLIDEVHMLSESRGSVLEAGVVSRVKIVSRIQGMEKHPISRVRFVAVSATIPNTQDLADWLEVGRDGLRVYGEEVRPVKLKTIVKGYAPTKNDFLFERRLNDYIVGVVSENSKGRPCLIFCSSRKGTSETAFHILSQTAQWGGHRSLGAYVRDPGHLARLQSASKQTSNKQLQQTIVAGIGFHHGGMEAADRALIESLFLGQDLLVLCTTATLAMGVNLPAHLVVLKGTRRYCGDQENQNEGRGYKEYDRSTCLQMVGRAGRPQFDTEGVAVIMTQRENVERYQYLCAGAEVVESQLGECFPEHLNAEIVLGTITALPTAIEWLKSTFMYVRVKKNPARYGIARSATNEHALEEQLKEKMILVNVDKLAKHGMVEQDGGGVGLISTEAGRLMAHYYIRFKTMINICMAPTHCSVPDLLMILGKSEEFENIRLRRGEKRVLNGINCRKDDDAVRFRVMDPNKVNKPRERISAVEEKIFILINEALSDNPANTLDASMRQESSQVLKVGERVSQAMARYFAYVGRLAAAANALILSKCLKQGLWHESTRQSRQLPNIGNNLSKKLADAGVTTLRQLSRTDPRRIETITQKHYPFGNQVRQDLMSRMPPEVDLEVKISGRRGGEVFVDLIITRLVEFEDKRRKSYARLIAGTIHNDQLHVNQQVVLEKFPSPWKVGFCVQRSDMELQIVASLIHEQLIGVDVTKKLVLPAFADDETETSDHEIGREHPVEPSPPTRPVNMGTPPHHAPLDSCHLECSTSTPNIGVTNDDPNESKAECWAPHDTRNTEAAPYSTPKAQVTSSVSSHEHASRWETPRHTNLQGKYVPARSLFGMDADDHQANPQDSQSAPSPRAKRRKERHAESRPACTSNATRRNAQAVRENGLSIPGRAIVAQRPREPSKRRPIQDLEAFKCKRGSRRWSQKENCEGKQPPVNQITNCAAPTLRKRLDVPAISSRPLSPNTRTLPEPPPRAATPATEAPALRALKRKANRLNETSAPPPQVPQPSAWRSPTFGPPQAVFQHKGRPPALTRRNELYSQYAAPIPSDNRPPYESDAFDCSTGLQQTGSGFSSGGLGQKWGGPSDWGSNYGAPGGNAFHNRPQTRPVWGPASTPPPGLHVNGGVGYRDRKRTLPRYEMNVPPTNAALSPSRSVQDESDPGGHAEVQSGRTRPHGGMNEGGKSLDGHAHGQPPKPAHSAKPEDDIQTAPSKRNMRTLFSFI